MGIGDIYYYIGKETKCLKNGIPYKISSYTYEINDGVVVYTSIGIHSDVINKNIYTKKVYNYVTYFEYKKLQINKIKNENAKRKL